MATAEEDQDTRTKYQRLRLPIASLVTYVTENGKKKKENPNPDQYRKWIEDVVMREVCQGNIFVDHDLIQLNLG